MFYAKDDSRTQAGTNKHASLLLATLLATLLLGCALFATGCAGNADNSKPDESAAANEGSAAEDDAAPSEEEDFSSNGGSVEGLPASFTAYGNAYSVSSYSIDVNADGNTVVTYEGTGFEVLPMREGSFRMPLDCTLKVDGVAKSWISGGVNKGALEFEFEGALEPEALVITAGDDDTQKVELSLT